MFRILNVRYCNLIDLTLNENVLLAFQSIILAISIILRVISIVLVALLLELLNHHLLFEVEHLGERSAIRRTPFMFGQAGTRLSWRLLFLLQMVRRLPHFYSVLSQTGRRSS